MRCSSCPSGVLYPHVIPVIGNGVVVDMPTLFNEIDTLEGRGVSCAKLKVSSQAHLIFPWHQALDALYEAGRGDARIGTTLKGIGPAYADKARREGVRAGEVLDPAGFATAVKDRAVSHNAEIVALGGEPLDVDELVERFSTLGRRLAPYVTDTVQLLHDALDARRSSAAGGCAGDVPRPRSRHLSVRHVVEPHGRRRVRRHRHRAAVPDAHRRHHQGVHHPGRQRAVPHRAARRDRRQARRHRPRVRHGHRSPPPHRLARLRDAAQGGADQLAHRDRAHQARRARHVRRDQGVHRVRRRRPSRSTPCWTVGCATSRRCAAAPTSHRRLRSSSRWSKPRSACPCGSSAPARHATPCWSGSDRSVLAAGDGSGVLRHHTLRPLPRDRAAGDGGAGRARASCPPTMRPTCRANAPVTDDAFVQAVSDREAVTDHDVAAFVDVVQAAIGQPAGAWIHYGLTSSDIVDTAWCWALRDAADLLIEASSALLAHRRRAGPRPSRHGDDRTHARHPRRADDVRRQGRAVGAADRSRSRSAARRAAGDRGVQAQRRGRHVLQHRSIGRGVRRRAPRSHAGAGDAGDRPRSSCRVPVGMCRRSGSTMEMIAVELRHLQRTEVGEVQEGFKPGQKGSSAMPHKRNPISAETISGLSRVLRGNLQAGMQDVALWHERDISHSSVERIILPDSSLMAYYVMRRMQRLLAGSAGVSRSHAHQSRLPALVWCSANRCCWRWCRAGSVATRPTHRAGQCSSGRGREKRSFRELLDADPRVDVAPTLLDEAFDLQRSLRHSAAVFEPLDAIDVAS